MTSSDISSSEGRPPVAPRRQVRLTGPSPKVDPQRVAVRRDLADIALADVVFAQHYAEPLTMRSTTSATVHASPAVDAPVVAALAVDDGFAVLELNDAWSWGRCCDGGCVGYVETSALAHP